MRINKVFNCIKVCIMGVIIASLLLACSNGKKNDSVKNNNYSKNQLSQMLLNCCGPITNLSSMQELINDGACLDKVKTRSIGDLTHGNLDEIPLEVAFEYNLQAVELLVNNGADVNYKLSDGSTPFFKAMQKFDTDLCDLFIKNGANIKVKNNLGYNALDCMLYVTLDDMATGYKNQKAMIDYLNNKGLELSDKSIRAILNCNSDDEYGYISSVESIGILKYVACKMLDEGKKLKLDSIIEHALQGDNEEVIALCNKKGYINNLHKKEKEILSYVVASYCDVDSIKALEDKEINIKKESDEDINTILCASAYNNIDMVEYLFEKNIRINNTDDKLNKAIDYAVCNKKIENIKYLIKNNAKIDTDTIGYLSLLDDKDIMNIFISYFKEISNEYIEALIGDGIKNENITYIQYISKYAIDTKDKDKLIGIYIGKTTNTIFLDELWKLDLKIYEDDILYYAIDNLNFKLLKYMVEKRKIDVNRYTSDYEIPLMHAIEVGNMEMIDYLVEHGARVDIVDGEGMDIVENAKESNYSRKVIEHVKQIKNK